ncbi:exodeoxyribonuclease V subunit gamma [Photobacterium damselae]|uniref:exodeoxyribonuclease V subunit gamma n=1 Tax=Photobacterium damselae TaxID=38293 RepID=UPI001EED6C39|nr:exodeoxyribonuclease V subunit gamma [Photobacterium damselae]UKA04484.1 exodeoxyribonuclease V subunit gamma [Photobacterium damselae subsp. damselae]
MFKIYQSNDMEVQRELLSNIIKMQPLSNVFAEELILVQNAGMSQWLKLSLSKTVGIVANTKFPMPSAFLWKLFKMVSPDTKDVTPFSKEVMRWRLIKLLKKNANDPKLKNIHNYLNGGDSSNPEFKLFQLAEKIADLYDKYQVSRPEWIFKWESNDFTTSDLPESQISENDLWQPYLWNLIIDDMKADGIKVQHRADLFKNFMDKMETGDFDKNNLPERIFMFGINNIPPQILKCLEALGNYIDIHMLNVLPCKYFYGDIQDPKFIAAQKNKKYYSENGKSIFDEVDISATIGNSLLASFGKVGRDHLTMLQEMEYLEIDAFVESTPETLLQNIQHDVLNLKDNSLTEMPERKILNKSDNSVIITSAYSKTREVEVLQDYLLNLFKNDHTLTPNDIVVMCASIDDYAPAIRSVFGSVAHSPLTPIHCENNQYTPDDHYIPFSISDRSLLLENPILESFVALLSINVSRNTSSEIIKILETPCILEKFGISAQDFDLILNWLNDVGIRWGLDENTATTDASKTTSMNTWLFGTQRMLMSYALNPSFGTFGDDVGYENINTSNATSAGGLSLFIECCIELRNKLTESRTVDEWVITLNDIIDKFFVQNNDNEREINIIRNTINNLLEQSQVKDYSDTIVATFDGDISSDVIRSFFNSAFKKPNMSQNFMIGKLTFATLMPMRSIPFKHVCLLGMNDGIYPRVQTPESWDLIAKNPQRGDRSNINDDKYLFLEAILAAKNSIYISYIGRSIKDNTERYPSSLVSELIDYCTNNYIFTDNLEIPDQINHHTPLSPFSKKAFIENGTIKSFASKWLPVVNGKRIHTTPLKNGVSVFSLDEADNKTIDKLSLQELTSFWEMPVRAYFTKTLNTNLYKQEVTIEDCEDFNIDNLKGYKFKTMLLDDFLKISLDTPSNIDRVFSTVYKRLARSGQLPIGHFGELGLESIKEPISTLARWIQPNMTGMHSSPEFELSIADIKLHGSIPKINDRNIIIRYRAGSIRPQDIINTWIEYLIGLVAFDIQGAFIFGTDVMYSMGGISRDDALITLESYVDAYKLGLNKPLAFVPQMATAVYKSLIVRGALVCDFEKNYTKSQAFMRQAMFGDAFSSFKASDNEYVQRTWGDMSESDYRDFFYNTIQYLISIYPFMSEIN